MMMLPVVAQTPPGGRMGRPAERWLAPLSAAERNQPELRAGLTRASVHRATPGDWLAQGQWSRTAEGKAIYRVALRSPEAIGLRLHFRNFNAGDGRVWMYPADGVNDGYFAGPYAARGAYGDGEFWSEIVEGESVVLEYETSREGRLPFEVDVVSHVFHEVVPGTAKASTRREALSCNKDAMCYPEWAERARSVGRYLFETNGGGALCSGSLINTRNSSGIPYFLTADHCVSNAAEARSVQVFWGYTSVACGGAPKNLRSLPTTLGATYLTGGGLEQGDFTLLRLNGALPDTVTFSGWTPDEHPVGGGVTGIHHPGGDYQRISFGARGDAIPVRGRPEPFYYTINWREGITEGGSSGSPLFNADGLIVGMLSAGPKPAAGKTECDLNPAFDWYGKFSTAYPSLQAFLEERTTGGGTTPTTPPAGGGTTLTNNTASRFQFAAVDGPTFMGETGTFRIDVPQGATRLEIRLRTTTANADVDLFVRAGSAPELNGGQVVSDYSGETDSGNETVVITATSNPPLRAGTYFATLAVFTPNVAVEGTITAIITAGGGGGGTPPTSAQALTSGQVRNLTIEPVTGATLLGGTAAYSIDVPAGSTRLEIRLETDNRAVDLDLFARFGEAVTLANGSAVADHRSEGPDGNETIVITPTSSPALRPGTYFIHLGVFTTNTRITSRLTATVSGGGSTPPPAGSGGTLSSGVPATYAVGPVTSAAIVGSGYQIAVPAGATRLEVRIRTTTPGADVDLYVREGSQPVVSGGSVVADYRSESDTGDETIVITPQSNPPLRSGTYFIALGLFTPNVRVQGTIVATVNAGQGGNAVAQPLLVGVQQAFRITAVTGPSLVLDPSFRVTVPQGATRMRVEVRTATPRADVDLFVRYEQAPVVSAGNILSDYRSTGDTGDEDLDIRPTTNPPLRAGTYYINLGLFTSGIDVQGTVTVYIDTAPAPPQRAVELTSGVPAPFTYAAVSQPTLYSGNAGFRVTVPQGATSMTIRLNTSTAAADLDLYVRRGADIELSGDNLVADYFAEGSTGNEVITISRTSNPPLEAGVYYIAIGNFARNVQVTGTLTATVERATTAPPTGQTRTLSLNGSVRFEVGPAATPTLYAGSNAIRLDVASVSKMEIVLTTDQEGVDTDLYVRYGTPPVVQNGNVVADFRSAGVGGNERVTIQPGANSPLRSGTYYIAIGLFSTGVQATGTVSAVDQSAGDVPKRMRLERFEKSAWPVDGVPLLKEKKPWRE